MQMGDRWVDVMMRNVEDLADGTKPYLTTYRSKRYNEPNYA